MNPVKKIREVYADEILQVTIHRGQETIMVRRDRILDILRLLRDAPELGYDFLVDLAGADHLEFPIAPERYGIAYHLYSDQHRKWLRIKAMVPEEDPLIDSATPLWAAADWLEREAYDMFGVVFRGHPDLRRILMPDDFGAHPLRKDYPIKGHGYRERFYKYNLGGAAGGAAGGADGRADGQAAGPPPAATGGES